MVCSFLMTKAQEFNTRLIAFTERFLTWRKRRRFIKKMKQKAKHPIRDWVESFLWAAMVVLLINQYFLQAYRIPSGSMIDTLMIKDQIFVNKMIYGPELIPGRAKVPGFKKPERGEVIIFESPQYTSKGPAFDVLQRVLYMLTLTLIDIDKDENGQPKAHFLIKRLIALDGDTIRFENGNLLIKPRGDNKFYSEVELKKSFGITYNNNRLIHPDDYKAIKGFAEAYAYENDLQIPITEDQKEAKKDFSYLNYSDPLATSLYRSQAVYSAFPHESRNSIEYYRLSQGRYVPVGDVLPLGDNRDNSNDGRYFGSLSKGKVLGRASFTYWPLNRAGKIR